MKWSGNDNYATPEYLYHALDDEFDFSLDPCPLNPDWATTGTDGLHLDWTGQAVFCNPPYSNIIPWIDKALKSICLPVFVLPARTETSRSHNLYRSKAEIRFFRKRIHFIKGGVKASAPVDGPLGAVIRRN